MEIEEFCQHVFGKWPMQLGALLDKDWIRNLRNLIFRDPALVRNLDETMQGG